MVCAEAENRLIKKQNMKSCRIAIVFEKER
jgi:hypothetical protein